MCIKDVMYVTEHLSSILESVLHKILFYTDLPFNLAFSSSFYVVVMDGS